MESTTEREPTIEELIRSASRFHQRDGEAARGECGRTGNPLEALGRDFRRHLARYDPNGPVERALQGLWPGGRQFRTWRGRRQIGF